jgi:hypothetical protein
MILNALVSAAAVAERSDATASSGVANLFPTLSVFAACMANGKTNASAASKPACHERKRILEALS